MEAIFSSSPGRIEMPLSGDHMILHLQPEV